MKDHIIEFTHRYFDFFVEPMKRWFPRQVVFWRPDNQDGFFAKRSKPLGYWLGHVVGYTLFFLAMIVIGYYLESYFSTR